MTADCHIHYAKLCIYNLLFYTIACDNLLIFAT